MSIITAINDKYHRQHISGNFTFAKTIAMTNTRKINTLQDYLNYEIQKLHDGEAELKIALTKWILKTTSLSLKTTLQHYAEQIKRHTEEIDVFFEDQQIDHPWFLDNKIMNALIEAIDESVLACTDHHTADVALLAGIQLVNHYKISAYGTIGALAEMLNKNKTAILFRNFEANEKLTDMELSTLAMKRINREALSTIEMK